MRCPIASRKPQRRLPRPEPRGAWGRGVATWLAAPLLAVAAAAPAAASPPVVEVPLLVVPATAALPVPLPPLRLADGLAPVRSLPAAGVGARDELAAMAAWNAGGNRPRQIGFARPLRQPLRPRLVTAAGAVPVLPRGEGAVARTVEGQLVWGARIRVDGAHRLRLRLQAPALPPQARLWVWGRDGAPRAFGVELRGGDGALWTPSVGGDELAIEIALPAGVAASEEPPFTVAEVLELFPAASSPPSAAAPACLLDAACATGAGFRLLATARRAVAHLEFVRSVDVLARAFLCTGSLLNDRDATTAVPQLLTAHHCFDSATSAASLEAFFDYFSPACGVPPPPLESMPRSTGARLLASAERGDVTLVELFDVPPGRTFLGWTTAPQPHGAVVHRLSHPVAGDDVLPQSYSRALVEQRAFVCGGFPRPDFLYSRLQLGGTLGGSSGSPVMTGEALVVGQLLGTCGTATNDPCDARDTEVDGTLAASFETLAPFLDPQPSAPCSPSPTVLCLDGRPGDRRYRVEVRYATGQAGRLAGDGTAVPLSGGEAARGGTFWFFAPELPEILVKLVDGCAANGHRWVFLGPATNVGLTVTVTDTVTGRPRVYASSDLQPAAPVQDPTAFPCE